jgi:hypothetical protein
MTKRYRSEFLGADAETIAGEGHQLSAHWGTATWVECGSL